MKKILVTSALPYINNIPHMGHMVGCHLPADIFARYCRQAGYDVTFVGGSDEHGTPSVIAAKERGKDIRSFVDELHQIHKAIYEKMNISYDIYSRTSTKKHSEVVRKFFLDIDKDLLIEKEEEHFYSEADEMFLPDRFLIGECPSCGKEANSDQCEACGKVLSAKELVNPKSILSGEAPSIRKSKHIYLNLEKIAPMLDSWLEERKDIFKKHVYSEAKKWIKEGLKARSITRDMSWGVPVPAEGYENKVFYVWFDAPIGYITFAEECGLDWNEVETHHFLGKDNIPFHTVFWPSMLLAAKRALPHNVVGYNYLTYEGKKFSKSKKTGVFCYNLLKEDINIDMMRFYLASSLPESKDSDFRWDEYAVVVNSQLIGNVANFFNRTISMVNRYLKGSINLASEPYDNVLSRARETYPAKVGGLLEKGEHRAALRAILEFASLGNAFIDKSEPWNMVEDKKALSRVLYLCLDHARSLSILMSPITPEGMESFWKEQLMLPERPSKPGFWHLEATLPLKHTIGGAKPLYKRVDEEEVARLERLLSYEEIP